MNTLVLIHLIISAVTMVYALGLTGMMRKKFGINTRQTLFSFETFKFIVVSLFPVLNLLVLLAFIFAEKEIIGSLTKEFEERELNDD